jgi:hypothetical protein
MAQSPLCHELVQCTAGATKAAKLGTGQAIRPWATPMAPKLMSLPGLLPFPLVAAPADAAAALPAAALP